MNDENASGTAKRQETLEEYKSLREETLHRIEVRYQIINLTLIATGALLTIGAADKGPRSALLVYPILSLFLATGYSYNYVMIVEIGKYIREQIEGLDEAGNQKRGGARTLLNLGWADYLKRPHDRIRKLDYIFMFGLFLVPQAISVLIYIDLVPLSESTWSRSILLVLCAVAFVATVVVLIIAIRFDPERRQKVRD